MNELNILLNQRQLHLLAFFEDEKRYTVSDIFSVFQKDTSSLATLKRDLTLLKKVGHLTTAGIPRNRTYCLSSFGLLHRPFDLDIYSKKEEYTKKGKKSYNFTLLSIVEKETIFTAKELALLNEATLFYKKKTTGSSSLIHKKELERFIIELSWKSSKIEGNTYTLLDTEKLLLNGVISPFHTKDETIMILNHKKAFEYILDLKRSLKSIVSLRELENIHRLLVANLGVAHGLRRGSVGITGSSYLPLSLTQTIQVETESLLKVINTKKDPYTKTLIAIIFLSYLQPFEDGNKRTSRLFGNGILLEENSAPLSYRSVDEIKYREAMLVFYEQNSIEPFKKIFIEQYLFSCQNYNLGE